MCRTSTFSTGNLGLHLQLVNLALELGDDLLLWRPAALPLAPAEIAGAFFGRRGALTVAALRLGIPPLEVGFPRFGALLRAGYGAEAGVGGNWLLADETV
jgi:hypothetical protein